jgi:hypothetical protein
MKEWINEKWCDFFHGGGLIKRDHHGRINWQCIKCGRWGDPVDEQAEWLMTERDVQLKQKERNK